MPPIRFPSRPTSRNAPAALKRFEENTMRIVKAITLLLSLLWLTSASAQDPNADAAVAAGEYHSIDAMRRGEPLTSDPITELGRAYCREKVGPNVENPVVAEAL